MCEHLEALMPKPASLKATPIDYIESFEQDVFQHCADVEEQETRFQARLYAFGLEPIRVLVLTDRIVYGYSFRAIAERLSIPSRQTAFKIYKKALALLAERGYHADI